MTNIVIQIFKMNNHQLHIKFIKLISIAFSIHEQILQCIVKCLQSLISTLIDKKSTDHWLSDLSREFGIFGRHICLNIAVKSQFKSRIRTSAERFLTSQEFLLKKKVSRLLLNERH